MIRIIADMPWTGNSLQGTIGNNGWLGGSEQEVNVLSSYLSNKVNYHIELSASNGVIDINKDDVYIIFNFFLLKEGIKKKLQIFKNYIIIEHDFKIFPNRIPDIYTDLKAERSELKNIDFYLGARRVFCLSENQARIFKINLPELETELLNTSFWSHEELLFIEECWKAKKNRPNKLGVAGVYNYLHKTKGTENALKYCAENNLAPLLLNPTDKITFLQRLALCDELVFLPNITESYSRISAEAKMIGLRIVHNEKVSFMLEPWLGNLSGKNLIDHFRERLMPKAIDKILKYLC